MDMANKVIVVFSLGFFAFCKADEAPTKPKTPGKDLLIEKWKKETAERKRSLVKKIETVFSKDFRGREAVILAVDLIEHPYWIDGKSEKELDQIFGEGVLLKKGEYFVVCLNYGILAEKKLSEENIAREGFPRKFGSQWLLAFKVKKIDNKSVEIFDAQLVNKIREDFVLEIGAREQ
ncbi:hypothetical protein N9183_01255 [bacterium]|nr:hypothetical protein [bacterium]